SGTVIGDANPPTNLRIENAIAQDTFGIYNVMKIRWDRPVGGTSIRYIVNWTLADGDVQAIETVELFTDVRSAERGTYTISVQALDLGQTLSVVVEDDFEYTAEAPTNLFRVTGLEIVGQGNVFTFEGLDVSTVWRVSNPSNLDALESGNFGSGADAGSQDLLFRDYEVKVIDPTTSGTRRITHVQDPAYTYQLSQNIEDSSNGIAIREFTISVAARDISNQVGDPSSITVSNPAPADLSNIQITRDQTTAHITFDRPTEPDWTGILVWSSLDSSVPTVAGNVVYDGAYSSQIAFNLDPDSTFFVKAAAYDSFSKEPEILNISDAVFAPSRNSLIEEKNLDIETPTTRDYPFTSYAWFAFDIDSINVVAASGEAKFSVKINDAVVDGLNDKFIIPAPLTYTALSGSNNAVAIGDRVVLAASGIVGMSDLEASLKFIRSATPTVSGSLPTGVVQQVSIDLDGTSESIANTTLSDLGIANDWTIGLWIKPGAGMLAVDLVQGTIIHFTPSSGAINRIKLDLIFETPGRIRWELEDSGGTSFKDLRWDDALTEDVWTFLSCTWDGTNFIAYKDGVDMGTADIVNTNDAGTMTSTNRRVGLGVNANDTAPFETAVESIYHSAMIWNTALSPAAMSTVYNAGGASTFDPNENAGSYVSADNLRHWWPLGLDSSDIGKDYATFSPIDVLANAVNVTAADIVPDFPGI
ncbi:hypothetical protein LCGC14_1998030, partial [marine sediment metagenome]